MLRRTRRGPDLSTPLDHKQKALLEQQEQLRQKVAHLNSFIEEAPKIAADREKKRREEIARSSRHHHRRIDHPVIIDTRHEPQYRLNSTVVTLQAPRKKRLAEKRAERMKFAVLLILSAFMALWVYHIVH